MPLIQTDIEPPTLTDFGLTEDAVSSSRDIVGRVDRRFGLLIFVAGTAVFLSFFAFVFASEWNIVQAIVASAIFGTPLAAGVSIALGLLLIPISRWALPRYAQAQHVLKQFEQFEQFNEAHKSHEQAQRRRQAAYWVSLSPIEFEHQIAALYGRHGYRTTVTPGSGDQGIDIIMYNDTEKIIVQCKRHGNPIGPATVRELYGALVASDAQSAILVCAGGFTKGVYEFARDTPITLLDIDGILELEQNAA